MNIADEILAKELTKFDIQEIPPQKDVGVQCESNNYPLATDLPLVSFEWYNQSKWISKSFILESGCYLRLNDVKNAFKMNEVEIYIGNKWVYLTEDNGGFVKIKFKPGSKYALIASHGDM
ncbi:uncharacterized protein LOC117113499 [Anneissia japonica]|uniref:uncharacterized protein LOC117113499 n=1 Tax=Anneissia japonica TaxID=1529436 RepID=UPI001425970F|nr:uncharacterized protein LOC117113499 [Anneissia japonica]